jgi:DNA-binding PadR family transcriptional regulator
MEVLLGLLTIEPMSGYDLGQNIRTSVGYMWNESYGQIYPNLKKLAVEGLVTAKRLLDHPTRPRSLGGVAQGRAAAGDSA